MSRRNDMGYDEHGNPTDPNHPGNGRDPDPALEKAAALNRRLETCKRAWRAGNHLALLDALDDCRSFGVPPPAWLVRALIPIVKDRASRRRQDAVHYIRWDAVTELRERRKELIALGYVPTWEEAYENASAKLRGTIAEGGADAIKASYQRVQKQLKTPKGARYFVSRFDPH
jgi:hypothetical protein